MLKTNMYLDKEELFTSACSTKNMDIAVREAKLDHLAYGRIDFYLDLGPNEKSLASVQRAGRGCLYVTYRNISIYLKLTSGGKIICKQISNKEEAIIIAALVRVFVLANYAINHRKVVTNTKHHRNRIHQNAARGDLKEPKISEKRISYRYAVSKPNGKEAWKKLALVPVKTKRRGHFRRYKNGKTVWINESVVIVYKHKQNAAIKSLIPETPVSLVFSK